MGKQKTFLKSLLSILLLLFITDSAAARSRVVDGEYIIKYKNNAEGADTKQKISNRLRHGRTLAMGKLHHVSLHNSDVTLEELQNDPNIEFVEPNFVLQKIDGQGEGARFTEQEVKYYGQSSSPVHATEAWSLSSAYSDANRPIVAIIDSGIDNTHPVFTQTNALWSNASNIHGWNFITNTSNYYDDDGHGTHVAGIVLGATQDILATQKEPAKIRIMALKFLDSTGSGSTANAVTAIYYAVNNGAQIINCSWGGSSYSRALDEAFTYAYNAGVMIVSAAGNYTNSNDSVMIYPANFTAPSNLSVAATADSDNIASFSNYGRNSVHLASPGVNIFSTIPGGWFTSYSGTSMAAPFVAGSAALALREAPQLTGYQLSQLVLSSVDVIASLAGKVTTSGRINSRKLLEAAIAQHSVVRSLASYSPVYKADQSVVTSSGSSAPAGCGLIKAISGSGGDGDGTATAAGFWLIWCLPLIYFLARRLWIRKTADDRKFDRFMLGSKIEIRSGDRVLIGDTKTISMGGLSFNINEALEKGGRIEMKVLSPDGKDMLEVTGHIVWSEQKKSYGVQFSDVADQAKSALEKWTSHLQKAR